MTQLTPIKLEDRTVIYMETLENVTSSTSITNQNNKKQSDQLNFIIPTPEEGDKRKRGLRQRTLGLEKLNIKEQGEQLQKTIQSYTKHIIQSFKDLALAEVTEVTLEFGVNVGGMTGIPYIATGNKYQSWH
jgi:Trypsin-co-occurring domain 1